MRKTTIIEYIELKACIDSEYVLNEYDEQMRDDPS